MRTMAIVPQITILAAMSAAFLVPALPAAAGGEVNVYTYRQPDLVRPVLEAFTKKTGITANLLYLDKGPIERMRIEG
jgi:iron(III) transport system substrate-binding protein